MQAFIAGIAGAIALIAVTIALLPAANVATPDAYSSSGVHIGGEPPLGPAQNMRAADSKSDREAESKNETIR